MGTLQAVSNVDCSKSILVTGAEGAQPKSTGSYQITEVGTGLQAGRPVYTNQDGQCLYYWAPQQRWLIGSSYLKPDFALISNLADEAWCPYQPTAWLVQVTGEGQSSHFSADFNIAVTEVNRREPCSEFVTIIGEEGVQDACVGIFHKVGMDPHPEQAGRPIYQ